jgi:hypothetical protein
VAALPWLSTKYSPMSAALAAVLVARAWIGWTPWPVLSPAQGAWRASCLVAVPYGLSLAGWFAFFQAYWGAPWPSGPYGTLTQTTPSNLIFGAPGLLFDQEYGLLPYAPVLVLAIPGLWRMLRRHGEERRLAVETLLVFGALFGTVGAFRIWWGGSAVVGRPVVSGLLLLALPIAVQFASAPAGSARRAAQHLLLAFGAALTLMLVVAEGGWLLGNQRDGTSTLLSWLSPRWELWNGVPTFVQGHTDTAAAWVQSLAWVAVAIAGGALLARVRPRSAGHASLTALATLGAGLLAGVAIVLLLPEGVEHPRIDLEARTRLAALDGFDRARRPIGVTYDPLQVTSPESLMRSLSFTVRPEQRTVGQPTPLLHNARFSIPAGRYRVTVQWTEDEKPDGPMTFGLQVGRLPPALREWTVVPEAGGQWEAEFGLPVDAPLFGFEGPPELERRIASMTLQALSVVNQSARPSTPEVVSAARFGDADAFFHDPATHGEPEGFWALGRRKTTVTLTAPQTALRLRVHGGAAPNRVKFEVPGWSRTLDLVPGVTEEIALPPSREGVWTMTIDAAGGFVPSEIDTASRDHRRLGAWIEPDTRR